MDRKNDRLVAVADPEGDPGDPGVHRNPPLGCT